MKETKERNTRNRGITLIALVITIIVMLILVAVTITVAVNGGLFEYAGRAGAKTNEAIANEQILASGKVNVNDIWYDSIDDFIAGEKAFESWPTITSENLEESVNIIITENTKYKDANGDMAIIPKGFMLTDEEEFIEDGIVIEDEAGNQFVWVPVEDGTFEGTEWFDNMPGDEFIAKMNNGDYTEDELITKLATYYALRNVKKSSLEEALVSKSIIEDVSDSYTTEDLKTFISGLTYFTGDIDKEEDIKANITSYCTLSSSKIENVSNDPTREYANMMASVAKYGGFYIGRYEAGSQTIRTDTSGVTTMVVQQGAYPYNWVKWGDSNTVIGETGAVYLSRNMYTGEDFGVISTLCYGVQWDATLRFIREEVDVTNSTGWGNYKNNTFDFTGEYSKDNGTSWDDDETEKPTGSSWLLTTGACDENQAKNIYDLAGNVYEWTMEESHSSGFSSSRYVRGGFFGGVGGGFLPASSRLGVFPETFSYHRGFRPTLYVK